ncbi:UNVERIFIED_CONTAM: hypothetical protein HDU68_009587 [Siphonaria sp. JEL0065]|nr:hypothetical protein HDU68_009587 [Siphonaria sp. JEL0065]
MPNDCSNKCGTQYALLGPKNEYTIQCACSVSLPSTPAAFACTLGCPGASIPESAPSCGGLNAGAVAWSAYAPKGAPVPVPNGDPTTTTTTTANAASSPTADTSNNNNNKNSNNNPGTADPGTSNASSSNNPSSGNNASNPSSGSGSGSGSIAIKPPNPGSIVNTGSTDQPNETTLSGGLISGVVGAIVILSVGFAALVQRRRRSQLSGRFDDVANNSFTVEFGDTKGLTQRSSMTPSMESFNYSSSSAPPLLSPLALIVPPPPAATTASNRSISAEATKQSTLNRLFRFGTKSDLDLHTQAATATAQQQATEESYSSIPKLSPLTALHLSLPRTLGVMPEKLKTTLKNVPPPPSQPPIHPSSPRSNHHHPYRPSSTSSSIQSRPTSAGGLFSGLRRFSMQQQMESSGMRASVQSSTTDTTSYIRQHAKIRRASDDGDGVSVAASSLFMNGLARNLALNARPDSGTMVVRPEAIAAADAADALNSTSSGSSMGSYGFAFSSFGGGDGSVECGNSDGDRNLGKNESF